ncbi:coiled-coil domain-containing protein [Desulfogranum japonicum]|uniref:hypothetical protein n=1 Tax=Desulfogranum japonicum TaxID=231447 RepID=UPI0004276F50|nr:hypothetical protein [Desulfogranum japonicum]
MKTNVMRAPLLKAGAVLVIFMLLVYLTSTSSDGSVWSSIGLMFIRAIQLVQWAIGMVLGIAVCLAVLFGIFLGAVAIVDRDSSARMYSQLKSTLKLWLADGVTCITSARECQSVCECVQETAPEPEVETVVPVVEPAVVEAMQSDLEKGLEELGNKIHALESKLEGYAPHQKVDEISGAVSASEEAVEKLHQALAAIESKLEETTGKLAGISAEKMLGDLPGRLEAVEKQDVASKEEVNSLTSLIKELQTELRESIEAIGTAEPEQAAAPVEEEEGSLEEDGDDDGHRLFTYFDDPADRDQISALVEETLKKDMTYAQVMDHLVKSMGDEKGQIIADHPSLAKDYIRQRRRG